MAFARVAVALAALSAGLPAPPGQRTHPHVRPRTGGPGTTFTLAFTLRSQPGHVGVLATDYRVYVSANRHVPIRCQPPEPASVQTGTVGQVERLALLPPAGGWCADGYTVTVYLERGPYCPPPVYGMPVPCPEFATQELDTGSAPFTVRR